MQGSRCLILDIGSGTQDVLLYHDQLELENCPKFVLPSPAKQVARRIKELTVLGRDIYLHGQNMGGGFWRALQGHQTAGHKVYAHPEAALALGDDLEQIKGHGIELTETPPLGASVVRLTDFDPGFWSGVLEHLGLDHPDFILAAVQDHGFHPGHSNRISRFAYWQHFMSEQGGELRHLLYSQPPKKMTRLCAVHQSIGVGLVADTGAAAMLGALFDPEVEERAHSQGVLIVNVGNSHTIAFLVLGSRVLGVYEHHTGFLNQAKLLHHLQEFRAGTLSSQSIFDDGGHGCVVVDDLPSTGFDRVLVLGPQRGMLAGTDVEFLAPGGDMMLAGCFGLLKGWQDFVRS